ncbi:MAG: 2-hydroxyacid dehydrogenase, partial [Candidatus Rokuibacteriota bacterium]
MERTRVLYGMPYGPPVYEIVRAACPPGLRVEFLDRGSEDELLARLPGYEFVIALSFGPRHFAAATKLRLLQAPGVGYDGVDLAEARARGIPVATTPEGTIEGVAEHVLLMILALNKQLLAADRALREGRWLVWQLRPTSHMLAGQTLGLVGLGRIGREVARRARGFDVTLLYTDPVRPPADVERDLGARYLPLDDLLRTADVVSLHTPLAPETRGLIGARELALMKPGAILVNTSRGGVVDEPALVAALRDGRLRGAGLDVFEREPIPADSPLLTLPNVV